MGTSKSSAFRISNFLLLLLSLSADCATVKDIFNLDTQLSSRVPRDNKYYSGRYGSTSSNESPLNRIIKPEDSPEAREGTQSPVEKRCTRCDPTYYDSRYPSESRSRYDDRRYRDRYDNDDRRYDRYDDRRNYDRYDDRGGRDRYRPSYDRDRYDGYDRNEGRYDKDRYDRDRYYDRDYDRGFGYDNRGYDYRDRGYDDRDRDRDFGSFTRPSYGGGRPQDSSYWGTGGYASNWNYGGRDDVRDRYGGGAGTGGGSYTRYRDPYSSYDGYRTTSYLYGRPSSTTTNRPPNSDGENSVTQSAQQENSS